MIVDTNVLLHLIDDRQPDSQRVLASFLKIGDSHDLVANEIIFSEVSPNFVSANAVRDQFEALGIAIKRLDLDECFRAGEAFRSYRRNGGPRTTILADFLIGAQASVRGWPILTRDTKRFSTYFPEVELIDPMQADHD